MITYHPEEPIENTPEFFKIEVLRTFRSAMERDITEGLSIRNSKVFFMNNMDEYGTWHIPNMTVDDNKKKNTNQ